MGMVAASELLLRISRLVRLAAVRVRSRLAVGLVGGARASADVLAAGPCLRHPAAGAGDAGLPRRRVPEIPEPDQSVLSPATATGGRRMSVIAATTSLLERLPVPDTLMRFGIEHLVGRTHRRMLSLGPDSDLAFAAGMRAWPIAE